MKDTAPKSLGILAVAALFGIVAWVVSAVVLDFGGFASFVIGLIVAIITAIVLWLGWREPADGPQGAKDLSADAHPMNSSSADAGTGSAGAAAGAAAATAAAATTAAVARSGSGGAAAKSGAGAKSGGTAKASGAAKSGGAKSGGAAKGSGSAKATGAGKGTAAKSTGSGTSAAGGKAAASKGAGGKASTAKASAAKSSGSAKAARAPVAKDGKPETLKGPRKGSSADNLKLIKGVGPGLEKTLNELGFYHFDQVAAWRKKEVQWVDDRLKFKGRIERDEWIKQAKILAKGGETEFSKRSKK